MKRRDIKTQDAWATGTGMFAGEYGGEPGWDEEIEQLNRTIDTYNGGNPKRPIPHEDIRTNPWDGHSVRLRSPAFRSMANRPFPEDGVLLDYES